MEKEREVNKNKISWRSRLVGFRCILFRACVHFRLILRARVYSISVVSLEIRVHYARINKGFHATYTRIYT